MNFGIAQKDYSMNNTFFRYFFAGLGGGLAGSLLILYFVQETSKIFDIYGQILHQDPKAQVSTPVLPEPPLGLWEKLAVESSLSTVGIQVFQGDKLVRQGSGVIVSSDGLITATADLIYPNAVYQIFYEDKILKGTIVARDYKLNLLLLKSASSYSNVANLDTRKNYRSGQDILVVGKLFDLSKPTVISQKGVVSYITERTVVLDIYPNSYISGSGAVNSDGRVIGIVYLRNGKVNLIQAGIVDDFFKNYLDKTN